MNSKKPIKCDSSELIDMLGARFEVVARMGLSDADIVLIRAQMEAGRNVPLHSHVDPECFYVVSGRLEVFAFDDTPRWHAVEAGQSLLVVDGLKHAVRNTADEPAQLILAVSNRLARYFREAGRPVAADMKAEVPSLEDLQRVKTASEAFGYWISSPAESAAAIASAGGPSSSGVIHGIES